MSTRIMYLRDNNNPQGKGNPIGCIAIGLYDIPSSGTRVEYQLSICHPNDKFDRQVGQLKAMSKLHGRPIFVDILNEKEVSIHQITSMVMSNIANNKEFTNRIRQSAQRWLTGAMLKACAVL